MATVPLNVVISYSHRDELYRQQFATMVAPLVREGLITLWSDHKIETGADIDREIQAQLKRADIILLLVSPDFLASDYCYCIEMETAIERHVNGHSVVIPVMLRYADWAKAPFSRLKALPEDAMPISSWSDQDKAWLTVAVGLREVIETARARSVASQLASELNTKTIRDTLRAGFFELQEKYEGGRVLSESEFGLQNLDEITNGLGKGTVALVAARPSSGQFDLCIHAAFSSALKRAKSVLIASPRLMSERISQRLLGDVANVDSHRLQRGLLENEDWLRINMAVKLMADARLHFYDELDFDLDDLESAVIEQKKTGQIDFLIIDGIEYLSNGSQGSELLISRRLRSLARRQNVAVLANLTLGPSLENRFDKRPSMSDLKEWHSFHQDADKVIFLYREMNWQKLPSQLSDQVELIIAKNSDGPVCTVLSAYTESYGFFQSTLVDGG